MGGSCRQSDIWDQEVRDHQDQDIGQTRRQGRRLRHTGRQRAAHFLRPSPDADTLQYEAKVQTQADQGRERQDHQEGQKVHGHR